MKVSLLLPTYNWPEALSLCLRSAFSQTRPPDEILVGDDGSTEATSDLIHQLAADSPVPFYHVWQPDEGFRAAAIRNKMLATATSDYILLVDSDMVLERHFVADHLRAARQGTFIQGSRVLLGPTATERAMKEGITRFRLFDSDIENRKNMIRSRVLSALASVAPGRSYRKIRTCNFALWRDDAMKVGGFDESYVGWGGEDTDLAIRLINAGVRRRNIRHTAVAFHLFHPTCSRDNYSRNRQRYQDVLRRRSVRAEIGLERYLEEGVAIDVTDLTPDRLRDSNDVSSQGSPSNGKNEVSLEAA